MADRITAPRVSNRSARRTAQLRVDDQALETIRNLAHRHRMTPAATLEAIIESFAGLEQEEQLRAIGAIPSLASRERRF
jgi:hypothetical protein